MEFAVQTRGSWDFVKRSAEWAERRGLAAVAVPDHFLARGNQPDEPAWDHLVHLTALATTTTRIELVSLVSPITFRHPAVLYKMAVTIDEISGGRFTLGLGAGWMEEEFTLYGVPYPDLKTRIDLLEEAFGYLRAAVTPEPLGFQGEHFQLAEFDPHPHPISLRLAAGGAGKTRARQIAATYCDEYNLYATTPDNYRSVREKTRSLAEEAGRDPDSILWSTASPAVAARKESDYRRMMERLLADSHLSVEEVEERWTERGYPHGSGSKASEMLAALEEAGCERYYAQVFVDEDDIGDFELVFDAYQG